MVIPPKFNLTSRMLDFLSKIQAIDLFLYSQNLPKQLKNNIQRTSLLKSSLFSARIEGNPLDLKSFQNGEDEKKLEVFNIINASKLIDQTKPFKISKSFILKLHETVLKDLSPDAGILRVEPSAIFNSSGVAVYISPSPQKAPQFLEKLLDYINSDKEGIPLLTAFIAHLVFEKIHPFLDGNGRVGRLLIGAVLKEKKWNLVLPSPFEEYLDEHKEDYYYFLERGFEETEGYLLFMLEGFLTSLESLKNQIETLNLQSKIFLPPRQEEIFNLIKDHSILSFDILRRRFQKVPERTLRYDLKKLVDKDLVEKTGETRGRYYRLKTVVK